MQNLLYFLYKYGYVLTFLALEVLCLNLVVRYNPHQNRLFVKSSSVVSGWILNKYSGITQYFGLSHVANDLASENALLLQRQLNARTDVAISGEKIYDSLHVQQYELVSARVINNSITGLDNYVTLNKGRLHGLTPGMGIVQRDGIIGITTDVTQHYARAISLLNRNLRVSAAIASSGFFGTLYWTGGDPRKVKLGDIPKHADLQIGDVIVTSGYGAIFPQGLRLGTVTDFNLEDGSNFYDIDVALINDLSHIEYVYVVKNLLKAEQLLLQADTIDGPGI